MAIITPGEELLENTTEYLFLHASYGIVNIDIFKNDEVRGSVKIHTNRGVSDKGGGTLMRLTDEQIIKALSDGLVIAVEWKDISEVLGEQPNREINCSICSNDMEWPPEPLKSQSGSILESDLAQALSTAKVNWIAAKYLEGTMLSREETRYFLEKEPLIRSMWTTAENTRNILSHIRLISQVLPEDPTSNDLYDALLISNQEIQSGTLITALFPDGWHDVILERDTSSGVPGPWKIATSGYGDVSPIGLYVSLKSHSDSEEDE